MMSSIPYECLRDLDLRARGVVGMAAGIADGPKGMLLRLGTHEVLVPIEEIAELMPPLPLTRVPGTKPWVLGICNLHGEILPVFDLSAFATGVPTPPDERTNRILVVEQEGSRAGLLVEAVLGQRGIVEGDAGVLPAVDDGFTAWFAAGWMIGGQAWPVLGLRRLVDSAAFHDVAA